MVVACQIEFDNNPHGTYFAGQVVTGRVTLTADKQKKVKGVALKIAGYAETHWTESTSHTVNDSRGHTTTRTSSQIFSGREDYIASLTYLLGSEANESLIIAPGIHTYNFACHIPISCPSSFEGTYGHIRYLIKISLIRPWKFDQTYTKGFTVLKIMDLNFESPLIRMPANSQVQKTYCCGPCSSNPLMLQISLSQSGFVPGQNIPLTVDVTNDSRVPVEELKIDLIMLVCYYSTSPRTSCKNSRITVARVKGEGVQRHEKKIFNYEIPVPATPPTCFNLCRILQVAYEINVEAKVKGFHENQVICVPVTIGNVPLMGVIQQQPMSGNSVEFMKRDLLDGSSNGIEQAATTLSRGVGVGREMVNMDDLDAIEVAPEIGQDLLQTPWNNNANIPPPSYEEAVHVPHACINADEKHDFGESDFAPRYPVFHLPTPTAPPPNAFGGEGNGVGSNEINNKSTWL